MDIAKEIHTSSRYDASNVTNDGIASAGSVSVAMVVARLSHSECVSIIGFCMISTELSCVW